MYWFLQVWRWNITLWPCLTAESIIASQLHRQPPCQLDCDGRLGGSPWLMETNDAVCTTLWKLTWAPRIIDIGISKNRGTPKSSILIGFSLKPSILGYHYFWKHPYWYGLVSYELIYVLHWQVLTSILSFTDAWFIWTYYIYIYCKRSCRTWCRAV